MQSVPATVTTAVTAAEREPLAQVKADWDHDGTFASTYDNLTPNVESVTVDRAIATDRPDAAKTVTGHAAAEATVELAGDFAASGSHVTQLLSAHNAGSPLAAKKRITAPLDVNLGFRTSAGEEWVDSFVGQIRSIETSADQRTVRLTALDRREHFAGRTTLPVVVADEKNAVAPFKKPGLSGSFLMDWVCRANGFYATPPPRASCKFSATMRGSAWPEVGTMTRASGTTGGKLLFLFFANLLYPERLYSGGTDIRYTPLSGLSTNNGAGVAVEIDEFWCLAPATHDPLWLLSNAAGDAIGCWVTSTGVLEVGIRRNSSGAWEDIVTGPTIGFGLLSPMYLLVHIAFTASGGTVTFRVNGTSTAVGFASGSVTGRTDLSVVRIGSGLKNDGTTFSSVAGAFQGVQVTAEAAAGSFNDTFVPTADIPPTIGTLTATPHTDYADDWALLQAAAEAENGFVMLDEAGRFVFRNRLFLSGGSSVATLSATTSLKTAASLEAIDTVRNRVRVPARPLRLQVNSTWAWIATDVHSIAAGGTLEVFAETENLVYLLTGSATFSAMAVGGGIPSAGVYRAYPNIDGTGAVATNITGTITRVDHDTFKLVLSNPNGFEVFLVNPSTHPTEPGEPWLRIWGRSITPRTIDTTDVGDAQGYIKAESSDATSITAYGEQVLDLEASPWRQDSASARRLADDLVAAMKDPHPVLNDVDIVADPRLQLGDRVTVVDADGLVLSADFWLLGTNTRLDETGMSQRVTLRQA